MDEEPDEENVEEEEFDVEKILGERVTKGKTYYKVRWVGYGPDSDTWEPIENLGSCKDLLEAYFERRNRHADQKLATLNKDGDKSKKPQSTRKTGFLLVSSSDEEADTVKDKFWELLEKGQIPLPEHDLYTNVKSCSRTSLPLSFNEGNDDGSNEECSDSYEPVDDICSGRQQSTSKANRSKERRKKSWRSRANIFSALSSSKPEVPLDGTSSASTAKADHKVNFLRDINPSADANISSQLKGSEQEQRKSVPSLDAMRKKSAELLFNAKKARDLEYRRHLLSPKEYKSSSKSHTVAKEKCSKSAHMDQSHDPTLKGLTPASPKTGREEVLPRSLPIFTGNRLEFVDDNDTSDSTEGSSATVSKTMDTQVAHKHSSTRHHRDHNVESVVAEMDQETGLFKRPKFLRETPHSTDQLREKKKISSGDNGSGDRRKEKHMTVSGKHSHSKEMRGDRPHHRETESGKKLHSPRKEDEHRKSKTDHKEHWVVKKDGSSHTPTHSDDAANRLILKFAKSHISSKEKHVHFGGANKPSASKSAVDMSLVKDGTLPVSQSKHSKSDGKTEGKHSSRDGSLPRKSTHHHSSASSSLIKSGKTEDRDSNIKPSGHHSSGKKHLVHKDATKTLDVAKSMESSKDSDQRKDVENGKEAVLMDATKTLDMGKNNVGMQPSRDVDKRKDVENRKDVDKRKDVENRKDVDKRKDGDKGKDVGKRKDGDSKKDADQRKDLDKRMDIDNRRDTNQRSDTDRGRDVGKRKDGDSRIDTDHRKDVDSRKDPDLGKDVDNRIDVDNRMDIDNGEDADKSKDVNNRQDTNQGSYVDSGKDVGKTNDVDSRNEADLRKDIDNRKDMDQSRDADNYVDSGKDVGKTNDVDSRKDADLRKDVNNRKDVEQRKEVDNRIGTGQRSYADNGKDADNGSGCLNWKDIDYRKAYEHPIDNEEKKNYDSRNEAEKRKEDANRKDASQRTDTDKTIRIAQNVTIVSNDTIMRNVTCEPKIDAADKRSDLTDIERYLQPIPVSIRNYRIPKRSVVLPENTNSPRVGSGSARSLINIETLPEQPVDVLKGSDLTRPNEHRQSTLTGMLRGYGSQIQSADLGNESAKHAPSLKRNFDKTDSPELDAPSSKRFRAENRFPSSSIGSAGYRNDEVGATLQLKERSTDAQKHNVEGLNDACSVVGEQIKPPVQSCHGIRKFMSQWPVNFGQSTSYSPRLGVGNSSASSSAPGKDPRRSLVTDDSSVRQAVTPVANTVEERVKGAADCDQVDVKKEVLVVEELGVQPSPRGILKSSATTEIPSLKSIALAAKSRVKGAVEGIKTVQAVCEKAERIWLQEELLLAEIVQRDESQAVKPDRNVGNDGSMGGEDHEVTLIQDLKEVVAGGCSGNAICSTVRVTCLEKAIAGSIVKTNESGFERNRETDAIARGKVPEVLYTGEGIEVITKSLSKVNIHRGQFPDTSMPETRQGESAEMNLLPWIKREDNIDAETLDMLLWKDSSDTETGRQVDAVAHGAVEVNKDQHVYRRAEETAVREDPDAGIDISECIYNLNTPSYVVCKQEIAEKYSKEQAGTEVPSSGTMPLVGEVNEDDLCCRNVSQCNIDSLRNFNAVRLSEFHDLLEELFMENDSNSLTGQGHERALQTSCGEEGAEELHDLLANVCQRDVPDEDRDLNLHALTLSDIVCKREIVESAEMESQNLTDQTAEFGLNRRLLGNSNFDVQESGDAVLHQKCPFQDNLSSENVTVVQQSDLSRENRVEIGQICFASEYADVLERGKPQESELQLNMAEYEKNCLSEGTDCSYPYEVGDVEKHLDLCSGYVNTGNMNLDENQAGQKNLETALCAAINTDVTEMASVKPSTNVLVTLDKIDTGSCRTPLRPSETGRKGILKNSVKENVALLEDRSKEVCRNDVMKLQDKLSGNVCKMNVELCKGNNTHVVEDQSNVNEEVTDVMVWDVSPVRRPASDPAVIDAGVEMEVEPLNQDIGTEGLKEKQPGATHALFGESGPVTNAETDQSHSDVTMDETVEQSLPKTQDKTVKTFNSGGSQFTIKSVPTTGKQRAGSASNTPLVQQGDAAKTLPESAYTMRETLKEKFMEGIAKDGMQTLRSIIKNTSFGAASDTSSPQKSSILSKKELSDDDTGLESMTVASSPGSARFAWNSDPSSSDGTMNSPAVSSSPSTSKTRAAEFGKVRSTGEPSSPASSARGSLTDRPVKFNVAAMGLDIRNLPKVVPPNLLNLTSEDLGRAVFKNDVKLVQFAFEREGAIWDLEQRDESGQTLVMAAVSNGNNFLLRLLVQRGALVNANKADGTTPLMIAAQKGFAKTVGFLLSFGSRIDDRACDGETALIKAARKGHGDVVHLLLDNGANFSPIMAGDAAISEVVKSHGSLRTMVLMHIHCLEMDFDCRAFAAIKSAGTLVRPLFPLQCLTVRDMKCFRMSFNYESLSTYSNSYGALLFIGHGKINYQSIRCLLKMDSYAVNYVTLNEHRQRCVEQNEPFCWTLVPLYQGINHIKVHLKNCTDPKVKLVMRAYQVMSV